MVDSFCFKFIYLLRERETAGVGQRERQRERIPSRFFAISTEPDIDRKSVV